MAPRKGTVCGRLLDRDTGAIGDIVEAMEPTDPFDPPAPASVWYPPTPVAGQLTVLWRGVLVTAWTVVAIGFIAVWFSSRHVGLSTWWLGPEIQPRHALISVVPFVGPAVAATWAFRNLQWASAVSVAASLATAAIGLGDLTRVPGLAACELLLAAGSFVVGVSSFVGRYRTAR